MAAPIAALNTLFLNLFNVLNEFILLSHNFYELVLGLLSWQELGSASSASRHGHGGLSVYPPVCDPAACTRVQSSYSSFILLLVVAQ